MANFAVLQVAKAPDGRPYFVTVTATGDTEALGLCVTDRMRRSGRDVDYVEQVR